jgi:hypothetical protein
MQPQNISWRQTTFLPRPRQRERGGVRAGVTAAPPSTNVVDGDWILQKKKKKRKRKRGQPIVWFVFGIIS